MRLASVDAHAVVGAARRHVPAGEREVREDGRRAGDLEEAHVHGRVARDDGRLGRASVALPSVAAVEDEVGVGGDGDLRGQDVGAVAEENRGGRRSGDVDGLLDGAERVGPVGAVTDAGPRRGDAEVVGDDAEGVRESGGGRVLGVVADGQREGVDSDGEVLEGAGRRGCLKRRRGLSVGRHPRGGPDVGEARLARAADAGRERHVERRAAGGEAKLQGAGEGFGADRRLVGAHVADGHAVAVAVDGARRPGDVADGRSDGGAGVDAGRRRQERVVARGGIGEERIGGDVAVPVLLVGLAIAAARRRGGGSGKRDVGRDAEVEVAVDDGVRDAVAGELEMDAAALQRARRLVVRDRAVRNGDREGG